MYQKVIHTLCPLQIMALAKGRRSSTEHSYALPTIMTNDVNEEGEVWDTYYISQVIRATSRVFCKMESLN